MIFQGSEIRASTISGGAERNLQQNREPGDTHRSSLVVLDRRLCGSSRRRPVEPDRLPDVASCQLASQPGPAASDGARLLRLSLGLSSPPPRRHRPQGVLPWGRWCLFGRPEAHGRAEGAVHGAFAVSGPVWKVHGLLRRRQPSCGEAGGGPLTCFGPPISTPPGSTESNRAQTTNSKCLSDQPSDEPIGKGSLRANAPQHPC